MRRIVIISLYWLLALATSASAECAWILWSGTLTEPIKWRPLDAFSSRAECQGRLEAVGRSIGGVYKCLPDTVDARGLKGK